MPYISKNSFNHIFLVLNWKYLIPEKTNFAFFLPVYLDHIHF